MEKHRIDLLKRIIETQKEVCQCCIAALGETDETTKMNLNVLGKFMYTLAQAEEKCAV